MAGAAARALWKGVETAAARLPPDEDMRLRLFTLLSVDLLLLNVTGGVPWRRRCCWCTLRPRQTRAGMRPGRCWQMWLARCARGMSPQRRPPDAADLSESS